MKTLRHTLTTLSLALTTLLTPALTTGCQDDPLYEGGPEYGQGITKAGLEMTEGREGPLQREGNYWVATKRVPLVGVGRVADDIGGALVSVLDFGENELACVFDDNLDNFARLQGGGAINANLLASMGVSIRDIYHTYRGGQTVGFVIKDAGEGGVLSLDVVQNFFIETYLNNKYQETIGNKSETATDVLNLNLFTPANSQVQTVSGTANLPFDEIRLCFGGVAADVLSGGIDVYYGFVGDNPEIRITTENFDGVKGEAHGTWPTPGSWLDNEVEKMFDPAYTANTDGPTYALAAITPSITVTLPNEHTIPGNAEIGFRTHSGSALGLNLFGKTTIDYTTTTNKETSITLDGGVVGLSLLGGGIQLLSAIPDMDDPIQKFKITFGGLTVDIGGVSVNYAYYREPVEPDPSYYFGIGNDTITAGNSYKLPKPAEGNVQYQFISGPAMAEIGTDDNGNAALHGMTVDGDYRVQALYTAPAPDPDPDTKADGSGQTEEEGKQIVYDFTITRKTKEVPVCHTPITVSNYPKAHLITPSEGEGCLLCIASPDIDMDEEHMAGNVLDANTNNFAGTFGGITVASQKEIVSIDAGQDIPINDKVRVGFVLQTAKEFLGVQALQFFRIVVKGKDANGNEVTVDKGPTAQNEGIGLGLLAGEGDKLRYYIEIDKNTAQSFHSIELYYAGVANVALSALRVYYPFWEDMGNAACAEVLEGLVPGDACIEMLSAQRNNATIDYALTVSEGLLSALTPVNYSSLYGAIDGSRNTYAVVPIGAELGSSTTLGIQFEELTGGQSIGVILSKPTSVADLSALATNTSIKAYYKGMEISEVGGSFQVADLKALGNGGRYSLEITPPKGKLCDAIQINFGTGLLPNALGNILVYGIYYRPDTNANGIPDCSETPDEDMPTGIDIDLATQDICAGDPLTVNAEMTVGAPIQEIYYLQCLDANKKETVIPVRIVSGKLVATQDELPLMLMEPGVYALRLYATATEKAEGKWTIGDDSGSPINLYVRTLTVHPDETTWLGNSTDWNNWDNWSDGVPWHCTNVIIPGNNADNTRSGETPANYPVLDANGDYHANNIYLGSGAQLVNSFYLNYNQAWVDISLDEGRYYLLSAPLKDTYSGDWFIPESVDNDVLGNFPNLNETSYPEQRLTPRIYQRLWSMAAPVVESSSQATEQTVSPDETRWTPPYNGVGQAYGLGLNFSLMADGTDSYTFRFPKKHGTYHYYGLDGQQTGQTESITRTVSGPGGRFIYETDDNTGWQDGDITVTLTAPQEGNVYLGGNPFLAHVDIAQLMGQNGISEIKVYDGNANNSLILVDGELVSTTGNTLKYLKPLEAFFVVYKDGASGDKELTFAPDMFSQGTVAFTRSAAPALPSAALRLTASRDGHEAHALLRIADDASADVVPGEDTQLLVEGEARPAVAVYTVAGGRALDIQQRPGGPAAIPLGFYLPGGGKADIRLTLDFTDPQWTDWFLVDQRTGQRQRITHTTLTLHDVESGSGQYVLMKN